MSPGSTPNPLIGGLKFLAAIGCLGIIWLGLLPRLAQQPQVAEHIRHDEQLGIDPSAMFYSELEIVPEIAHRMERLELLRSPSQASD